MEKVIILLAIIVGLSSCEKQPENKTNPTDAQQVRNVELTRQFFTHFNNHEWEKMAAMYVERADFKDPSLGQGIVKQTREETIAKYSELNGIFADLHDEVIQIYPSGEDHVIVEFISTGTAPDSSTFELPVCAILTFDKGKISKDFKYYDNFDEGQ
jgi:ketosteroid isomerase-like protein